MPSTKLKQPFDPGIDAFYHCLFRKHFSLRMQVVRSHSLTHNRVDTESPGCPNLIHSAMQNQECLCVNICSHKQVLKAAKVCHRSFVSFSSCSCLVSADSLCLFDSLHQEQITRTTQPRELVVVPGDCRGSLMDCQ